jgi:beta-N-acetylhexosaminidase
MVLRGRYFIIILLFIVFNISEAAATEPPFVRFKTDKWVTEQLEKMTLDEKIAQLMTIAVYPDLGTESKNKTLEQIQLYKPGGILVMQGKPVETAKWINDFQQISKIPLLVSIDGEWGLAMRIDSIMKFPYAQAIGAVQDSTVHLSDGSRFWHTIETDGNSHEFCPGSRY